MVRYKDYDYSQGKFIPIHFDQQILPEPSSIAFITHWQRDRFVRLWFTVPKRRDRSSCLWSCHSFKIILYATRGDYLQSKDSAVLPGEHHLHGAVGWHPSSFYNDRRLHLDLRPGDHPTLSWSPIDLWRGGLIGKEMFAVDGCKLPSNASKEWIGTKGDLQKKKRRWRRRSGKSWSGIGKWMGGRRTGELLSKKSSMWRPFEGSEK